MKNVPGNTPLVELKEISKYFGFAGKIYAKVESFNPSGSVKDRPVYQMLLGYKERCMLKEGTLVVEATSGNTGIALAYFSKLMNYRAIIVMPSSMSQQRRDMIKNYGGELVLVDGGMKQCEEKAAEIVKNTPNSFQFNQFGNEDNPKSHYIGTGPEIFKELPMVDYFFAGFGTGGTVSGVGKYVKDNGFKTKVIGVEPFESPLITKGVAGPHKIQGIGANFIPKTLDKSVIDEIVDVKGDDAIETAKLIRSLEKIDIGFSSGAALMGAIEYIKNNKVKDGNIVVVFPDKGDRYSW